MAESIGDRVKKLIAEGKLKPIDFGPPDKNYKPSKKIVVDSKALKSYLWRKRELETKYFPKVKIMFDAYVCA